MSIRKFEMARGLISAAGGGDFDGPKPNSLVAEAETALGLSFPPSYRQFLLELGCGNIGGLEVYGLINDNFHSSTVPNGVWLTLNERRAIHLNPALVIVGEAGDGTYYALDTSRLDDSGEAPVVHLSVDGTQSEEIASSFGDYLLEAVRRAI
jgi:hypothetical protein